MVKVQGTMHQSEQLAPSPSSRVWWPCKENVTLGGSGGFKRTDYLHNLVFSVSTRHLKVQENFLPKSRHSPLGELS